MTRKNPDDIWHTSSVLGGRGCTCKCLVDGMSKEDQDDSVMAIHFAGLADRAEFASEALELDGLSSGSGRALSSWMP